MKTVDEKIEEERRAAQIDRNKAERKIFHNNDPDEINACRESAENHEQYAEWLEDYKKLKAKDTPAKPKIRHYKPFDDYNDGWCPCCGAYIQEMEYDRFFCQSCGQRLDWPEG